MTVSFDLVNHTLKTLPVGYYLGRNIKITLSEGRDSYYHIPSDSITIGYASIADAFKTVVEDKYTIEVEEVVRGLLYHEISHVILTPKCLIADARYHDIINIFEDERIETILKNKYMNTNFKKNLIFLTSYDGSYNPKTALEAFYMIVRYHNGKKEFIDRVRKIIKKYIRVNHSYGELDRYGNAKNYAEKSIVESYVRDIIELYNDIAKDFRDNRDDYNNSELSDDTQNNENNNANSDNSDSNSNDSDDNSNTSDSGSDNSDSTDDESNSKSNSNESNTDEESPNEDNSSSEESLSNDNSDADSNDESESVSESTTISNSTSGIDVDNELTEEVVKKLIEDLDINVSIDEISNIFSEALESTIETLNNSVLTARLKKIIDEKMKLDNKNGAAINAYSGRFDPRAVARRDDYKWWSQQNVNGDIRKYSKVHFNLFIDNSGSFRLNDTNMNMFIQSLNKVVSKDFDFDVITINTRIDEWENTTSKLFHSTGGNTLTDEISKVVKRHTKSQSNNYNIILFDGDANPDKYSDGTTAFKYFDGENTIIVTDGDNEKYVKSSVKKAKIIVTNDYCNKFIDTVLSLLERVI